MLLVAGIAYLVPQHFLWLSPWVPPLLGLVMFGMGLMLSLNDFRVVLSRPMEVLLGVFAQYSLMPAIAYGLCVLFDTPREIAIGVILIGACPGGTSSNVFTYLARGDLALSVTLTCCTTLLAPIVTPAIFAVLAQEWITVDTHAMFWTILQIVLLPIGAGLAIHTALGERIDRVSDILPIVSIASIILIVAAVVAGAQESLAKAAPLIFAVVALHNGLGLLFGYLMAIAWGFNVAKRRCLSIEVGTQNAGLGATLAAVHFAATPMVALPAAVFSFWNVMTGSLLAGIFRKMSD